MKKLLLLIFTFSFTFQLSAQSSVREFKFGKEANATIQLIDREMTISKDWRNSTLKFEIVNNSDYPIYVAQPEVIQGTVPQYFNLLDEKEECIFEDVEMLARNAAEFIFIPANSSKEFELHDEFYLKSCIAFKKPSHATLVYRAFNFEYEDIFLAKSFLKNDRSSRDICEYMLTTKMKSQEIKLNFE